MDRHSEAWRRFVSGAWTVAGLVILLAALRFCHVRILWADEDYHLAAALNILHGKLPYRDFWYDKPPLTALYYLLIGGYSGWPLRLLDMLYVLGACFLMYRLARAWYGEKEARLSALLLAFFLTFYLPSAVMAFAADALMLVPHLAAVYYALGKRAFLAGICCAVAFLVNAKAVFVLAVCALWLLPSGLVPLGLGFFAPVAAFAATAFGLGIWSGYIEQVWRWGWIYAAGSPVAHPVATGFARTLHWLGFHAALAGGTVYAFARSPASDRWRLGSWTVLSFAAVCLGTRFAPHYFLQLLPVMILAGSHGFVLAWARHKRIVAVFAAITLLIPLVRFGPRYVALGYDALLNRVPHWSDVTMDTDSRQVAELIHAAARPGDTLFVWGYRPDMYVYTRLTSDSKFWDSQPLTGVPADRHLQAEAPIYSGPAARNRLTLIRSRPTWFVDGLGPFNPKLAPAMFLELRPWLKQYRVVARTNLAVIYHIEPRVD